MAFVLTIRFHLNQTPATDATQQRGGEMFQMARFDSIPNGKRFRAVGLEFVRNLDVGECIGDPTKNQYFFDGAEVVPLPDPDPAPPVIPPPPLPDPETLAPVAPAKGSKSAVKPDQPAADPTPPASPPAADKPPPVDPVAPGAK